MKKSITVLAASLLLALGMVMPASGNTHPAPAEPETYCGGEGQQPCPVVACDDLQAGATGCEPSCQLAVNRVWKHQVFPRDEVIAAQAEKIAEQRSTIKRLRAKLMRLRG